MAELLNRAPGGPGGDLATLTSAMTHPGPTGMGFGVPGGGPAAPGGDDPPMLDLASLGLTEAERQQIEMVMMRHKEEESKEQEIIRKKQEEVKMLEETIRQRSQAQRKAGLDMDATCHICLKTKFADGVGHSCNYCGVRCCARCGGKVTLRSGKVIWVCIVCRKKQELLIKTGAWIHGPDGPEAGTPTPLTSGRTTPISGIFRPPSRGGQFMSQFGRRLLQRQASDDGSATSSMMMDGSVGNAGFNMGGSQMGANMGNTPGGMLMGSQPGLTPGGTNSRAPSVMSFGRGLPRPPPLQRRSMSEGGEDVGSYQPTADGSHWEQPMIGMMGGTQQQGMQPHLLPQQGYQQQQSLTMQQQSLRSSQPQLSSRRNLPTPGPSLTRTPTPQQVKLLPVAPLQQTNANIQDPQQQLLDPNQIGGPNGSITQRAANNNRKRLDQVLRNDSLSSDQSESVRPPPPRPHKNRRESLNKKPRPTSLSSSDEEVRSTPDCTSCDDPDMESVSERDSEKGETASGARSRGGASDGRGYSLDDDPASDRRHNHHHHRPNVDRLNNRRERHYHQDYRTYKDEYRELDPFGPDPSSSHHRRQMPPHSRSLPVPAPSAMMGTTNPAGTNTNERRHQLLRHSSERYPGQEEVELERTRFKRRTDQLAGAVRGASLPQPPSDVPTPRTNTVLDRRKKTVRFDGAGDESESLGPIDHPIGPGLSGPSPEAGRSGAGAGVVGGETSLERDWSQDSGSGSGTFKDSGIDSSSNLTSSEDSNRGGTLVIGVSPQPLSAKHPVTWKPSTDGTKLIGHMILKKNAGSVSSDPNAPSASGGQTPSSSANILGLKVVGGKTMENGKLGAVIEKVKRGSIADQVGHLRPGDEVLEWNGRSLQGKTFEEVSEILAESKQEPQVELMVTRLINDPGAQRQQLPPSRRSSARMASQQSGSARLPQTPTYKDSAEWSKAGPSGYRVDGRPSVTVTSPTSPDPAASFVSPVSSYQSNGRIQVRLWFAAQSLQLVVSIIGACDLPPKPSGHLRNPYAKLVLLPDRSEKSKRRTRMLAGTCDPMWKQRFVYSPLRRTEINLRTLEITVWDFDQFGPNEFLGQVLLELGTARLDDAPEWHWLRFPTQDDYYGPDARKSRCRDHLGGGDSGESASIGTSERLSPPSTTSRLSDSEASELDYDASTAAGGQPSASSSAKSSQGLPQGSTSPHHQQQNQQRRMHPSQHQGPIDGGSLSSSSSPPLEGDPYYNRRRSRPDDPRDRQGRHQQSYDSSSLPAQYRHQQPQYQRSLSATRSSSMRSDDGEYPPNRSSGYRRGPEVVVTSATAQSPPPGSRMISRSDYARQGYYDRGPLQPPGVGSGGSPHKRQLPQIPAPGGAPPARQHVRERHNSEQYRHQYPEEGRHRMSYHYRAGYGSDVEDSRYSRDREREFRLAQAEQHPRHRRSISASRDPSSSYDDRYQHQQPYSQSRQYQPSRQHHQPHQQHGGGSSRVAFDCPDSESTMTLTSDRAARMRGAGGGSGEFVDSDIESEASMNSALSTQSERPMGRRDGGSNLRDPGDMRHSMSASGRRRLGPRSMSEETAEKDGCLSDTGVSLGIIKLSHDDPGGGTGSSGQLRSPSGGSIGSGKGGSKLFGPLSGLSKKSSSTSQLSATGGRKKRGSSNSGVQRSQEVMPAGSTPVPSRHPALTKQRSKDSDGSVNSISSEGSSWMPTLRLAGEGELSDFVEGLGPGQLVGRQVLGARPLGEVQLSLSDHKGKLEVKVIRARRLEPKAGAKIPPAPYVKLYLVDGKKCLGKAKTTTAKRTLDPQYQQSLIFTHPYQGAVLQVTVWGDYGRMEGKKVFMGVAQIMLDDLDMSNVVFGWYKLYGTSSLVSLPAASKRQYGPPGAAGGLGGLGGLAGLGGGSSSGPQSFDSMYS